MKTVYIVRHGESEANVEGFYQGMHNSPLTERGREQARVIAERCSRLPAEVLIASPMLRARQTAELISERVGLPVEWSDLFVEAAIPSIIVGKNEDDSDARAISDAWDLALFDAGPKVLDGEHFSDVFSRADEALLYLREREESNILLVTHGLFLRVLLARIFFGGMLTGEQFKRFVVATKTQNTGISIITDEAESAGAPWRVSVFNDHSHLG